MADKHYTAVIEVKVSERKARETDYRGGVKEYEREVTDVARIVVRAETMEKLRDRMLSHVELIEED